LTIAHRNLNEVLLLLKIDICVAKRVNRTPITDFEQIVELITKSSKILVLTGAGVRSSLISGYT
jgi:hypothetical protein